MSNGILRSIGNLVLSGLLLASMTSGHAAEFPSRAVDLVVNFAAGGIADMSVRSMTEQLSRNLGVPVVVINKGGSGGAVGAKYVMGAAPNGYTVLASSISTFNIVPLLNPGLGYQLSDFIPLARYINSPNVILVRGDSPFEKLDDLIAYLKKNPGKLSCGHAGVGTASEFALEMLKNEAGISFVGVPYKGGGELNAALLGGHVDFLLQSVSVAQDQVKSGRMRALSINSYTRSLRLPDVPTLKELGYPKSVLLLRVGFFLPKGTPKPIVDALASAFEKSIKDPVVGKRLENQGIQMDYEDGPRLAASMAEEYKVLEEVGRKAKIIK